MRQHFKMVEVDCDLLIIGGGLAGCWAAIKAKEVLDNVILVEKGYIGRSGQTLFAGTVQYPRKESSAFINICCADDDAEAWLKEIVEVGDYLNDQEWVKVHLEESYPSVMELEKIGEGYGVRLLERDASGSYLQKKFGLNVATSTNFINALSMMDVLRKKILKEKIRFFERIMVTDLVVREGRAVGAIGLDYRSAQLYLFKARAIIIAAAGCGFKSFMVGHMNLTGEGQAMAYEVGAVLRNMEQVTSVPTAKLMDTMAIWSSLGLGSRLINSKGEEFMWKYDSVRGNRARIIKCLVAFAKEIWQGNGPIYLDMSSMTSEARSALEAKSPETLKGLASIGIDPFRDKIEYILGFMGTNPNSGGIHIDTRCSTNVPGLYAIGDSTCCPLQGTWSVNGLNLSFCLVSGKRAAWFASEYIKDEGREVSWDGIKKDTKERVERLVAPLDKSVGLKPDEVTYKIQETLLPNDVCYLREEGRLKAAIKRFEEIRDEDFLRICASDPHELAKAIEVRSMLTIGELILQSALYREESRGFHYREDYPLTDNLAWLKWIKVQKGKTWGEPVPTPYVNPPMGRYEHR